MMPQIPDECVPAWHLFFMLMETRQERDKMLSWLRDRGIGATFHYIPLHDSPMGRDCGRTAESCSVTVEMSERLVRLPLFSDLRDEEMEFVVNAVKEFR